MTAHDFLHDFCRLILQKILQLLESRGSFWYMIWWVYYVMFPTQSKREVSQPRKKQQSLHTSVLQAHYLHWPGEESRHTSAISCPTWLGPRLIRRALWRRLLRSSKATQLSASWQPWKLQNSWMWRRKTDIDTTINRKERELAEFGCLFCRHLICISKFVWG